ncbi:MAG: AAC(3) family N-acetyltransferase [Ruminococcus sp.]|nr:AAC(3) family N-acetyltransferase [Ruminococcus sp.]MDE6847751.1 AAC(3) family N-acetyltransferase [Ruminococcus sp.]MDE7138782.1 AAC(3) family N-acetyltransferase [Ruminococcus sp.]
MEKHKLVNGFKNIGIQKGMILEIHSSLSSFGHIKGGADTVIDALMECLEKQ